MNKFSSKIELVKLEKRANVCLKACEGITTEALEAGIVEFAINEVDRIFTSKTGIQLQKKDKTFHGVKVWEKEYV